MSPEEWIETNKDAYKFYCATLGVPELYPCILGSEEQYRSALKFGKENSKPGTYCHAGSVLLFANPGDLTWFMLCFGIRYQFNYGSYASDGKPQAPTE